jgi:methyl-accepting chemotaxis protein
MKFNNIRIAKRLAITFGIITLMTLTLLLVSYQAIDNLSGIWRQFQTVSLEKYAAAYKGKDDLGDAIHMFKDTLLRGKDEYKQEFAGDMDAIDRDAERYASNHGVMNESEKTALQAIKEATAAYRAAMKEVILMKASGASIEEIDSGIKGADRPLGHAFDDLLAVAKEEEKVASHAINSTAASSKQTIMAIGILAAVLGILFAWLTTVGITRPLREAVGLAGTVAKGDLTQRIEVNGKDECGELLRALQHMSASLVTIVGEVRNTTEAITAAAQEIATGNSDLSQRTEQQASSLEETASSMEELTSTVKQNAGNAKQASQLATRASDIAIRGGQVVDEVVKTMVTISASSAKISDIISVIEGIAFQTNILALNAAVEAARAGEQGRGFAVVASEVRNLAQRSATAAKEIATLIEASVDKIYSGSRQVDQAGATMNEIVTAVKHVNDIMAEIAAASDEQSAGIEEVNQAINQMDAVTQQNAALVEEAAAAAESMREQANTLGVAMAAFRLGERSEDAGPIVVKHVAQFAAQVPKVSAAHAKNLKLAKTREERDGDWNEF